jgi:ParB family transcriptional regulator, chromosome partitioning protein
MRIKSIEFTSDNSRTIYEEMKNIESLMDSIKQTGLIAPIVLQKVEKSDKYNIIAGQRRFLALSTLRGENGSLEEGEFVVRDFGDAKEVDILEVSIIENQHREALSPMDLNRAALKLNQMGSYSDKEIAKVLNISPHRLKRIVKLGQDRQKMTEEIREELKKSGDDAVFTDAHWDKMRDIDDPDTVRDVFDQIMDKQLPPRDVPGIINAVQKANDAYDDEHGKGTDSTAYVQDDEDDNAGPIKYKHKGELTMEERGDGLIFKVQGRGEDDEVPTSQYLEYLRHPEKFKCKIDLKLTFIPID